MPFPPEVQDCIIDALSDDLDRPQLLKFRLVSREWIPRVDFYGFRYLRAVISEGPSFLVFIKESINRIGIHVRRLDIRGSRKRLEHISPHYTSLKDYLFDFAASLPYLETLRLIEFTNPFQVEHVPHFPSIKTLYFRRTTIKTSQLMGLISAAPSLETLVQFESRVVGGHGQGKEVVYASEFLDVKRSDGERDPAQKSLPCTHLKTYSTAFLTIDAGRPFEAVLFPLDTAIAMPSLTYLRLSFIGTRSIRTIIRLIQGTAQSLRFLCLSFERHTRLATNGNVPL